MRTWIYPKDECLYEEGLYHITVYGRLLIMAPKELHVKAEILGLKIGWIARMYLQRVWLKYHSLACLAWFVRKYAETWLGSIVNMSMCSHTTSYCLGYIWFHLLIRLGHIGFLIKQFSSRLWYIFLNSS